MASAGQMLDKLTYVAWQSAQWLLKERGIVQPFGVGLDKTGDKPFTYFPADAQPGSPFDQLLSLVEAELARCVAAGNVGAVAAVYTMQSGDRTGFAVQADSPAESRLLVYPYCKTERGVEVSAPLRAQGRLVRNCFVK